MRLLLCCALLLVLRATPPAAAASPDGGSSTRWALGVLHAWDARRAEAWSRSDAQALRHLYVDGSVAADHDVSMLRAWRARRLVVRRLRTQVFAVRVVRSGRGVLVLRVLDRVTGGEITGRGAVRPLPTTTPVRREVELRRIGGTWRVAGVRALSGSG